MMNSHPFSLARMLTALAALAPQTLAQGKVVADLVEMMPAPRANRSFPHRSGEGPRETARRRKQIAAGTLRISEADNA
jgi:hypothetical protein